VGLDQATSALIADIYAGMHDPAIWDRAIDTMCQRCGVDWALVGVFDERRRAPIQPAFHRIRDSRFLDGIDQYNQDAFRFDPTNQFAARRPAGGVFDSVVEVGRADYLNHEFVRWLRGPLGSTTWRTRYTGHDGLQLGISLHSSEATGPLSDEGTHLFGLLFDHIKSAAWSVARATPLDGPEPIILLDGRGNMCAASEAAQALLAGRDGLAVVDRQVRALARRSAVALDQAIRSAIGALTEGGAGGSAVLERRDGAPLLATVTPLSPGAAPLVQLRPAAMIRLVDPSSRTGALQADWRALFGFTPAETRLARA
jgi:hypothetical protein